MQHIIRAENVVKRYAAHTALNNVSLGIPEGSSFGLLGPNGAGKTSFIRLITRITAPDAGQLFFKERPMQPADVHNIGYLPEERGLYKKMKVGEQLLYLAQLKGLSESEARTRIRRWFQKLDLMNWWDKSVQDLSKGMQQKVQFIATVVHEPALIILDEPFSGFDPINANIIKEEIKELQRNGATVIFSTHRMESVEELCTHVALINKSQVVLNGAVREIKRSFSKNLYLIEYAGSLEGLNGLGSDITVADREVQDNGYTVAHLSSETISGNQLLRMLIDRVEVRHFQQQVPSFNDIFIQVVNEGAQAAPAAADNR